MNPIATIKISLLYFPVHSKYKEYCVGHHTVFLYFVVLFIVYKTLIRAKRLHVAASFTINIPSLHFSYFQ